MVTQDTDGYEVVLSLAELDPVLGGNPSDLLFYADTEGSFPADAVARTVMPGDNLHGRRMSNLDAVVVTDVPQPGSLTVLTSAMLFLGCGAMAMKRR